MNWKSPEEASRFVTRYADTILRLCMTYSLSRADAQDICQTVFCRLLRADMTFDTPEVERAYVIRCTINACKDLLKSAWWRRHATLHEASHLAAPHRPRTGRHLIQRGAGFAAALSGTGLFVLL